MTIKASLQNRIDDLASLFARRYVWLEMYHERAGPQERPPFGSGDVPLRSAHTEAARMASLLGLSREALFAITPFTIPGDDWVQLIDDGEPICKRGEVRNDGDTSVDVEVTWGDDARSRKEFRIKPKSSMLFECRVAIIRVRGKGGSGTLRTHDTGTSIFLHGPGDAYYREPGSDTIMECRTFEIRNCGKKKFKVTFTRDSPGTAPDEKREVDVEPSNTTIIRCKIRSIHIDGDPDLEAWVEEVSDVI